MHDSALESWIVAFCTFGFAFSYGVFQDYYVNEKTSSSSNISCIGSLQIFFLFSMGLLSGKLFDQGYFHHIMISVSLLYVFSLMMLSIANPTRYYELLLAQGISGSSIGGAVYPIMLNQLFNHGVGFAWGVRAAAFMTLGMLIIANLTLSTRPPSAKERPPGGPKPQFSHALTDVPYMVALAAIFVGSWGLLFPYRNAGGNGDAFRGSCLVYEEQGAAESVKDLLARIIYGMEMAVIQTRITLLESAYAFAVVS
ncbi:hypothetical protein EVJ58_g3955 [Rhodofomes roseus]|uniref:MFS transporter n=1 Tax=Rhodofomes roseus TaxID=34475 RepID=A0A4Y9YID0_9APHY|nr:hypothetical protein EVJ58_g3955 [Rhodofomes roseus]